VCVCVCVFVCVCGFRCSFLVYEHALICMCKAGNAAENADAKEPAAERMDVNAQQGVEQQGDEQQGGMRKRKLMRRRMFESGN